MPQLLVNVLNPLPSDDYQFGGDWGNRINDIHHGVATDEDININTEFKFYSGMLSMYDDDPARTHKVTLKVANIGTGSNKSITIRDPTIQDDFLVTEGQSQTIYNKILGNNVSFAANPDFNGVHLLEAVIDGTESTLQNIPNSALNQITDKAKLNSNLVYTDQNNAYGAFFQTFRSGYLRVTNPANTFNYALVGSAIGGNYNLTIPLITANDTFALQGVPNTFTDWQTIQKASNLPLLTLYNPSNTVGDDMMLSFDAWSSTGVKRNYAQIYGSVVTNTNLAENGSLYFNIMSGGSLSTKFAINHNGYVFIGNNLRAVLGDSGLSAQRIFSFPDTAGQLAVLAHENRFTTKQVIQYNTANDPLSLVRLVKTAGSTTGIYFKLQDSADNERTYAGVYGGIGSNAADNTSGAENGQLVFYTKVAGVDTLKIQATATQLKTYGMVPDFEVGSGDLNSMVIYRPVNSSGSNIINFNLQNVSSVEKTFGYVGIRSETVTAGAEVGSVQLGAMEAGALQLQAKIHSNKTYLYNSSGFAAILDPVGLSASRTFTFPDGNGQIMLTAIQQTVTNKTVSSGWTITGDLAVNNALGLHITKNAGAGVAEVLAQFDMGDASTSYLQINNGSVTDGVFIPRVTSYNSQPNNAGSVGFYLYSNIDSTSDTVDSFNAVTIFDSRRSNSTAIQFKRLFQFRNAGTNVVDIYTDKVSFNNNKLSSAVVNLDDVTIKHSTTNTAGDIPYFDGTRYNRKPQGSNNQFLGVVGGVLGYYTPTVGGVLALAALTDDVQIASLQDNDIIRYDSASGKWKNEQLNTTAGLVSNIGGGIEIFKQLAATNELRTLTEGMGIDLTQNADTITVALGTTITLPSAQNTMVTWSKPNSGATGAERLMGWTVDDDPNGSILSIENLTGNQGIFTPGLIFTQNSSNAMAAGYILGRIADAHDIVNEVAAIQLNARRPTTGLVNRPLIEITNYSTKEYIFYHDRADFKGNELRNAAIHSSVTGIVNGNIAAGANIAISKIDVVGGLASTTSAGFVELAENNESAANVVVQGSDSRLSDARVPLVHANSHAFGQSDALSLAFHSGFDYLIFKSGSTYYLKNNSTGVLTSNASPNSLFQTALTAGGSIYVFEGDYNFTNSGSVLLSMPLYPLSAELYMSAKTNLIVPNGYDGVLLQFRHAAVGGAGVYKCKVYGGIIKEAGTRQELYTAIQFYGDAGVSVAGVFWNTIENTEIMYPKKGIHLLNASGGSKCFFNANIFRNIKIWYPIEDGVHFDMQSAYVAGTNGFHRNRFEYVSIQGAGVTGAVNPTVGFRDIRQSDNSFIGCYPVDFTGSSKSATIGTDAISTIIIGGTITATNFEDNSTAKTTKIMDQYKNFSVDRINPANGSNLETLMGSGATTLTWSFWNSDSSERFYIQKNATDVRFDFVKQTAGGALRPVLFRQYDVPASSLVESFRIETDAGLRVWTNKFRLLDSNQSANYIFNVSDLAGSVNVTLPPLAASDEFTFNNHTQALTKKTISGLKVTQPAAKTSAYTVVDTDVSVPCNATSAAFTVTLPAASGRAGMRVKIWKTDSSANAVTIDGNASETINGNTTMLLTAQYQTVELECDGTGWFTSPYSVVRRGKSTATGNGSATVFNVPHGLGVDPHDAIITCRTHTIATYTTTSTNIVVTLSAAPANGASVIFDWSAVP